MIVTVLLILLGSAALTPLLQRDLTRAAGAQAEEPRERCFVAVVDGTTVAYRADEPLDEAGQRALAELVRAAVHHVKVRDPDLEERQAAARERNRARLIRLGLMQPDQEDR